MRASKLRQAFLHPSQLPRKPYGRGKIQTGVMILILFSCFMNGIFLKLLPYEHVDGNPVPAIIFKGLPLTFHAFVISIILAFTGAFGSLLTRGKVKYAKYENFSRVYSLVFMGFAIAILVYAVSLSCFISGDQKMQMVTT